MPDDIQRVVRRAWKKPHNEKRQQALAEAWERDPDAVEAAFEQVDGHHERARRPRPPRPGWDPRGTPRARWENPIGTRTIEPLLLFHPENTAQVAHILKRAGERGHRVRAVGNGHSATDCMVCGDYLVATSGLDQVLPLEQAVLHGSIEDPDALVRVQAGIRIDVLNDALAERGRCMPNNTAYDGQTLVGVFATGSHGTGMDFGAVADHAESLTVVGEQGAIFRIESSDGVTHPGRFAARHPGQQLVQDDDVFAAHLVAMGCLGIVTEVVLRTVPTYHLEETRFVMEWEDAKRLLTPAFLRAHRHVAVLLNPYIVDDERTGIHGRTAMIAVRDLHPGPPSRHSRYGALVALANLVPRLPSRLMKNRPDRTPSFLNQALRTLGSKEGKRFVGRGDEVLNFGGSQRNSAYALNVGVEASRGLHAIDAVVSELNRRADEGLQYVTAPISIRWTGPSRAFMAPMFGRDTCMIEPPCLHPTVGGFEILASLQQLLYRFGGRPHWGLEFNLTGTGGRMHQLWGDAFDRWLVQFRRFNANGTFDSVFTERIGLHH